MTRQTAEELAYLGKLNGISTYPSTEFNAVSMNLNAVLEGVARKAYMLISASDNEALNRISDITLKGIKEALARNESLDLSFDEMGDESLGVLIILDDLYHLVTSGGSEAYIFPEKRRLLEGRATVEKGGFFILSNAPLKAEYVELIASLTQTCRHPSEVMQSLKENAGDEGFSMAMAAIKVNILGGSSRLRGSRALSCRSNTGMVRRNNEDACLTISLSLPGEEGNERRFQVLCVADGAGGQGLGEIASREAILSTYVEVVRNIIRNPEVDMTDMLGNSILRANQLVVDLRRKLSSNMATTLELMVIYGQEVYVGHVGDGRTYIIDSRGIEQLTRDHKLVEEMVERGQLTRQEAKVHQNRNIITSALGMEKPRVDTLAIGDRLGSNTSLLLSTDGLTDVVDDSEIAWIVNGARAPGLAANGLINLANERGGPDNVSIAMLSHLDGGKENL